MLIRCIRSEKKKSRHPILWLATLGIPLIPTIMGTFNYLSNLTIITPGWHNLWTQETLFYANFFSAPPDRTVLRVPVAAGTQKPQLEYIDDCPCTRLGCRSI